ncbi:oligosaccharide flippase family protein [Patescibacteria group bacterium]|nr:oligosaccharide flippase family protein [Patescibacteria group bacterium]MBU1472745.1 oligosaccharide flippase family protein [Patescibacteria group bacterium]MBU2460012.1 oligosaccharide flippase family protein [Patescibacteria group bacterium]MBU2544330.1 oligosaccharide flippase family protein [Patescibacteria group bacterium]
MEEIDIALIKKRSLAGVVALTSRTFFLQLLAFGATFLLTIFLTPAIFGIFYVVSAIISFLGYFSDIGLAAALIQKKEPLTHDDLATTFTIQQILVAILVIFSLIFSDKIASFYRLDTSGVWLLRALIVSFFLSSLKTIPSVLLERKLAFQLLIIPQILETVCFYTVAVVLAWRGYGITSFSWAVLTRGIIGLIAMYVISPWRMSFGISRSVTKKLLHFGIPFQFNSLLALIKDDLLTVFLGKVLPFAQVGYIGWAKKWAEVPLRLFMDSVIRVTFPAFSRIQKEKELLAHAIEKTLFGLSLTIFPVSVGLLFFVRPLVYLVPRYIKWEPALFSFSLFVLGSSIASLSTPLTNALNAVGKIKVTLFLMVLWTVATWVLTVLLISYIGFDGVALALLLITTTIFLVIALVKRIAPFSFFGSIRGSLIAALAQTIWYFLLVGRAPYGYLRLVSVGVSGICIYGLLVWVFERQKIRSLISDFRS